MEPYHNKGLVMGIFANIPNFVLAGLTLIFLILSLSTGNDGMYAAFIIFNTITRFHASMYLGFITAVVPGTSSSGEVDYTEFTVESILFLILPIISPIVTHIAYKLGEQDKKIFDFKNKK